MVQVESAISIRGYDELQVGELVYCKVDEDNEKRSIYGYCLVVSKGAEEFELVILHQLAGNNRVRAGYIEWLQSHYISYGTDWIIKPIFSSMNIKKPQFSYLTPGVISLSKGATALCVGPNNAHSIEILVELPSASITKLRSGHDDHITTDHWELWLKSEVDKGIQGQSLFVHVRG